ncbi:MAG: hypothetical protein K2W88_21075, partial [Pararheinheimera sp.]|nr:hypothetical protein [Rheinheimera sp.]
VLESAADQAALEEWIEQNQLDVNYVSLEQDNPELAEKYAAGEFNLTEWEPTPISKNSFLLMLTDTENGPIAMWATSHLQIQDYVLVDGNKFPCIKV